MTREHRPLFRRILGWLRAGYPDGVPREDYVVLLGVLKRHLTEPEIIAVTQELAEEVKATGHAVTTHDVAERIAKVTLADADPEDVERVAARLAAGGWPVDDLP